MMEALTLIFYDLTNFGGYKRGFNSDATLLCTSEWKVNKAATIPNFI